MLKNAFVGSLVSIGLMLPMALRAADDKSDAKKPAAASADAGKKSDDSKIKGRLPNNYGKLGLTEAQREKIYTMENSFTTQIEELQKKIADLQSKRDADMRNVLTADQQKKYDELTAATGKAKADKKAAAAEAKKSGDATPAKSASTSK